MLPYRYRILPRYVRETGETHVVCALDVCSWSWPRCGCGESMCVCARARSYEEKEEKQKNEKKKQKKKKKKREEEEEKKKLKRNAIRGCWPGPGAAITTHKRTATGFCGGPATVGEGRLLPGPGECYIIPRRRTRTVSRFYVRAMRETLRRRRTLATTPNSNKGHTEAFDYDNNIIIRGGRHLNADFSQLR